MITPPGHETEQGNAGSHFTSIAIPFAEALGARLDPNLEVLHVDFRRFLKIPLFSQRMCELQDLDLIKWLLDHHPSITGGQGPLDLAPTPVGKGGADHDLQRCVDLPELLDGREPVPARRHAHVDERQRVWAPLAARLPHELQGLLSLKGRIDLERKPGRRPRRNIATPEERRGIVVKVGQM
ncbi:MAG TPA: hypothetical protein VGA56_07500 [Opitutaceae bacterium]